MTTDHLGRRIRSVAALLLAGYTAAAAVADDADDSFRQSLSENLRAVSQKVITLAEAIDADKFSWRPTSDVRSISQVYIHIVGTNFHLPATLGAPPPAGIDVPDSGPYALSVQRAQWEAELVGKEDVVDALRRSFDYALQSIPLINDLDAEVAPFGFKASKRDYLLLLMAHAHEHLGQSIAYARSAGVVPPWSRVAKRPEGESTAIFEGGSARGQTVEVDRFGNLATSFVGADLDRLGLQTGDSLTLSAGDKTFVVFVGESFFDVRMGEWVAFLSQTGQLMIGRSYASAASTLGVAAGDPISIRASEPSP